MLFQPIKANSTAYVSYFVWRLKCVMQTEYCHQFAEIMINGNLYEKFTTIAQGSCRDKRIHCYSNYSMYNIKLAVTSMRSYGFLCARTGTFARYTLCENRFMHEFDDPEIPVKVTANLESYQRSLQFVLKLNIDGDCHVWQYVQCPAFFFVFVFVFVLMYVLDCF